MTYGLDRLAGKANATGDFLADATAPSTDGCYDVLIFADSRGYSMEERNVSWTFQLYNDLVARGWSVMVIVRPCDITGLFTLYNFLESMTARFRYAVCQVGMAEFTPKSRDALDDLLLQKNIHLGHLPTAELTLDRALVFSKRTEQEPVAAFEPMLVTETDTPDLRREFVAMFELHLQYALVLSAVEFDPNAKMKRLRSTSYFEQVRKSNRYLRALSAESRVIHYLEPIKGWMPNSAVLVHDGAHYTTEAHRRVFEVARAVLCANTVKW